MFGLSVLVVMSVIAGLQATQGVYSFHQHEQKLDEVWESYKIKYDKVYSNDSEEMSRKEVFIENLQKITEHNELYEKGLSTYSMGVNKFTDMSHEDFITTMTGCLGRQDSWNSLQPEDDHVIKNFSSSIGSDDLPGTVDWRSKGYVTPVKEQTGSMEGQYFRSTRKLVSLSEQQIVDCSKRFGNHGCAGGLPGSSYKYIKSTRGLQAETTYPYKATEQKCQYDASKAVASIKGYVFIKPGDELALKLAVATVGPVYVSIDSSQPSFQHYRSGVYSEPRCQTKRLNHAVLAVGYGTLKGVDYWLVKNSWGTKWGNGGYILMSRNKKNQCGIATRGNYPLI